MGEGNLALVGAHYYVSSLDVIERKAPCLKRFDNQWWRTERLKGIIGLWSVYWRKFKYNFE
jgi:hypothetical protein